MNIPSCIRLAIERMPCLYMSLLRIKNKGRNFERFIVCDETELVVEGFPRCANSFAAQSIRLLCRKEGRQIRLATHSHSPAQVVAGLRLNKPTLVLIREPRAAITSLQALSRQSGVSTQNVNGLLKRYIQFYEMLQPFREQMVVAEFKRTTSEYPEVIRELNRRFDLSLPEVEDQEALEALVIPNSKAHLSPSEDRDAVKQEIQAMYDLQADQRLVARAEHAYRNFIEKHAS